MSAILQSRPYKSMTDGTLIWDSRWNSGHDPVEYKFQRQDYQVANITQSLTKIRVTLTSNVGQPFTVGDMVFISDLTYKGTYEVIAAPAPGAQTQFDLDRVYSTDSFTGCFANNVTARKNYYLEVKVMVRNFETGAFDYVGSSRFTGDENWIITADIQQLVRTNMKVANENPYYVVPGGSPGVLYAYHDTNTTARFIISYKEVWFNSAEVFIDDLQEYYATKSVRQIQQTNGTNLAEFVGTDKDVAADYRAKFISDFREPCFFVGYPFDLAFLFTEMMENNSFSVEFNKLNIYKNSIGHTSKTLGFIKNEVVISGFPCEARLKIDPTFASDVAYLDLWLEHGGLVQVRYVEESYYDEDYTQVIPPTPPPTVNWIETEVRRIKIEQGCFENPVYLAWKGSTGGWNYWLFTWNQERKKSSTTESSFEKSITNLETSEGSFEVLKKKTDSSLKLGATGIDVVNLEGIESILDSPKVQMLVSSNPVKWQTVEVQTSSFVSQSKYQTFDVEFLINLPKKKIITQ